MEVKIRKANSKDLIPAWRVKEKCRRKKGMLRQDFLTFSADFSANKSFIAENTEKVVGFIICRNNGYISIFGVHPDYTREGIGTALVNRVKSNHKNLWCHVRITNDGALEFYENYGFDKRNIARNYYVNGDDAYVMVYSEK
ncbi:MAG: Acetyltransferase GNAT family [Candidatus Methanohalarchaeum thermophilum]|uniref:Acetyltransferase GNAT family n=1 Tax=Methanohalarchaeum thermophilum TaxID=1903181 RepID=A0A1Q6DUB2_METT1|nr:MAG: Acetyltransferase GNAT family [Candidatus Methanohalarchaeum thermophilum]